MKKAQKHTIRHDRLQALLDKNDLAPTTLATQMGWGRNRIYNWLRAPISKKPGMKSDMVLALANRLNCDAGYLFGTQEVERMADFDRLKFSGVVDPNIWQIGPSQISDKETPIRADARAPFDQQALYSTKREIIDRTNYAMQNAVVVWLIDDKQKLFNAISTGLSLLAKRNREGGDEFQLLLFSAMRSADGITLTAEHDSKLVINWNRPNEKIPGIDVLGIVLQSVSFRQ